MESKSNQEKIVKGLEILKEKLTKENIDLSHFKLEAEVYSTYYSIPSNNELNNYQRIELINKQNYDFEKAELYKNLKKIGSTLTNENYETIQTEFNLVSSVSEGEKYVPIKSNDILTDEEKVLYNEGAVSVIDVWANWCGPCVKAMQHNFEIIEKNFSAWNGKVKFYTAASTEKEETVNYLNDKNWNRFPEIISHYLMTDENPANEIYKIQYIPFLVIVDQNGIIRHAGSVGGLDVEKLINELLEGKAIGEKKATENKDNLEEKFKVFPNKLSEVFKSLPSRDYYVSFRIQVKELYDVDLQNSSSSLKNKSSFSFKIECFDNEYNLFKNLLAESFTEEEIENNQFIIKKLDFVDFSIPETSVCNSCQKAIDKNNDLTYFCFTCKIFFCAECVKERKSKHGFEALVHKEHYLIVFKNPDPKNLINVEKYKLGENLFASFEESKLNRDHGFGCNGCIGGEPDLSERYICLTCRRGAPQNGGFVDICGKCFRQAHEDNDEELFKENSHKPDHVYLQMIYCGKNYYDY